ncbi:unnamed protein product, partial [Lymnaea stagnalis]
MLDCELETRNCTLTSGFESIAKNTKITLQDIGASRGVQLRVGAMPGVLKPGQYSVTWSLCDGHSVIDSCQVITQAAESSVTSQKGMLCPTAVPGQDYAITTEIFTNPLCGASVALYYGDLEIVQCEESNGGCVFSSDYEYMVNRTRIIFQVIQPVKQPEVYNSHSGENATFYINIIIQVEPMFTGLQFRIEAQPDVLSDGQYTAKWTTPCSMVNQSARCQVETQ